MGLEPKKKVEQTSEDSRIRWNPTTKEDIDPDKLPDFYEFIDRLQTIADETFGVSESGDSNVDIIAVDRSIYWPMFYRPIKYGHKAETDKEAHDIFDSLLSNLGRATEDIRTYMSIMRLNEYDHDAEPIWEIAKRLGEEVLDKEKSDESTGD